MCEMSSPAKDTTKEKDTNGIQNYVAQEGTQNAWELSRPSLSGPRVLSKRQHPRR